MGKKLNSESIHDQLVKLNNALEDLQKVNEYARLVNSAVMCGGDPTMIPHPILSEEPVSPRGVKLTLVSTHKDNGQLQ